MSPNSLMMTAALGAKGSFSRKFSSVLAGAEKAGDHTDGKEAIRHALAPANGCRSAG
jgi:hypothetical protein